MKVLTLFFVSGAIFRNSLSRNSMTDDFKEL